MRKTNNKFAVNKPVNKFQYPQNNNVLVKLPVGVVIPAEVMEVMGYVTALINYHRNNRSSSLHKAAMLVDCVSYDELQTANVAGWIGVHFLKSTRTTTQKTALRNLLSRHVSFTNKTYGWSGVINRSMRPGCDSRIAIGPHAKRYGAYTPTHSTGAKYIQKIIVPFN